MGRPSYARVTRCHRLQSSFQRVDIRNSASRSVQRETAGSKQRGVHANAQGAGRDPWYLRVRPAFGSPDRGVYVPYLTGPKPEGYAATYADSV